VSASDLGVVLLAFSALVLVGATVALWFQVRTAAATVREAASALEDATTALTDAVADARAAAAAAHVDAARIDALLRRSEGVVDRVDAASDLAYETFSRPVIKAMAVGAGTR
jgi:hypothetical protein